MATAAPACRAALNQATVRWPGRRKLSDGIMGDPAHQGRPSDHNLGNAFDLTHDPAHGVDCRELAVQIVERARTGREPRAKYVIWNRRIASAEKGWTWRSYSGSNPHDKHMHVSIYDHRRDDTSPWWDELPRSYVTAKPVEDELTPDDRKWLDARFDAIDARLKGLEGDVVTVLRGPSHPSLTRILERVTAIAKKVGAP